MEKSEKLKDVIGYTHAVSKIAHHFTIRFPNGSLVDFNPTTKTSGKRKYLLVRDEGGKIYDKDAIKRWREADGMLQGTWKYKKRDRYCSTPSVGSAFDGIDDILERDGRALKHDYTHFPWVHVDEQEVIEKHGRRALR